MGDVLPDRDCARGKVYFHSGTSNDDTYWGWGVANYGHHRYYNSEPGNIITAFTIHRTNYGPANAALPAPVIQCTNYRYFDAGNAEPVVECQSRLRNAYVVDNYDKVNFPDSNLIDGNYGTFAHTQGGGWDWGRVRLLDAGLPLTRVVVTNRQDCCRDRLKAYQLWIGNDPTAPNLGGNMLIATENANGASQITTTITGQYYGQYLFVWKHDGDANILNLGEVEAFYSC